MKRSAPGVLALAVVMLQSACGFHLQGHTPLPALVKSPYLETQDRQSLFTQSLRHALLSNGAQLADSKSHSSAVVHIIKENYKKRVLSVSATNQPNEYEITYTITFEVVAGDKDPLPAEEISSTRTYSFDERLLLAKGHEEDLLRADMARDLADRVMRRLASL
jgi:LPS-assembly lipoprotein